MRDLSAAVALSSQLYARSTAAALAKPDDDDDDASDDDDAADNAAADEAALRALEGAPTPRALAELARMSAILADYLAMVQAGFDARPARDFCAKQGELLLALERLRAQTDRAELAQASGRLETAAKHGTWLAEVDGFLSTLYASPLRLFGGTRAEAEVPADAFVALVGTGDKDTIDCDADPAEESDDSIAEAVHRAVARKRAPGAADGRAH
jgi:hypothetical protein